MRLSRRSFLAASLAAGAAGMAGLPRNVWGRRGRDSDGDDGGSEDALGAMPAFRSLSSAVASFCLSDSLPTPAPFKWDSNSARLSIAHKLASVSPRLSVLRS